MEKWADIQGYEGRYQISDAGRVKSLSRVVRTMKRNGTMGFRRTRERILSLNRWGANYPGVILLDASLVRKYHLVHRLVAAAFVPNPNGLPEVNHIDADTWNATAKNLEWCDKSGNLSHAYRIGRRGVGKEHHFAVLPRTSKGHCTSSGQQEV